MKAPGPQARKHEFSVFDLAGGERWMWLGIVYMCSCPIIAVALAIYRWWWLA
jgi:hypothetical protein